MKGCSMVLQRSRWSRWKQLRISLIWRFNWESWAAGGHETRAWLTINQRVNGKLSEIRGCNQEIVLIGKVNRAGWRTLIYCLFSELLNAERQVCCLHLLCYTLLQKKSVKGLDLMFAHVLKTNYSPKVNQIFIRMEWSSLSDTFVRVTTDEGAQESWLQKISGNACYCMKFRPLFFHLTLYSIYSFCSCRWLQYSLGIGPVLQFFLTYSTNQFLEQLTRTSSKVLQDIFYCKLKAFPIYIFPLQIAQI